MGKDRTTWGNGAHAEMVRVLEEDPDLAVALPASGRAAARSAALAPLLTLEPGAHVVRSDQPAPPGHLGMLILDGLIAIHVRFGQLAATDFAGPSDLLRPWAISPPPATGEARWETLTPARIAVLDRDFATRMRAWPEFTAALFDRYTERLSSQLLQSALRKARRVEDRVLIALWHFAGRWGRVCPEGRKVDLPKLTGEVLANIVGARRQSVSTALTTLTARGAIQRRPDGSWIVSDLPDLLQPDRDPGVADLRPAGWAGRRAS